MKEVSKEKVLSFELLKIEKGRERICKCNPPHYEIDVVNHIVTCKDCGATVEPFDALVTMCQYMDKFAEYQREAIEKISTYRELANKEWRRIFKNRIFKEMDYEYQKGLYPICPKCGEIFNPIKITRWANEKLCEEVEQ